VIAGNGVGKVFADASRLLQDGEISGNLGNGIGDQRRAETGDASAPDGRQDADQLLRVQVGSGEIDSGKTVYLDIHEPGTEEG